MNKKTLKVLLKLLISVALLYVVYRKINFGDLVTTYKTTNITLLVLGSLFCLVATRILSQAELYFHQSNFKLSQKSNLKLYFVGMFYNFFIPGGIGGDAYKIYLLNKRFHWKIKKITQNVLIDRLVGLVAIILIAVIIACQLFIKASWSLILGIAIAILIYFIVKMLITKLFIKNFNIIYPKSLLYSIAIQLLQILCVYFILASIGIDSNMMSYFLVFLVSSVASVISFSGFGAREYIFFQAAVYLGTDTAMATSIGLTFNMITALISLFGLFFLVKKIDLKLIST